MDSIQEIEASRNHILEQLRHIKSLRRGTINEQFFKGKKAGKTVTRGPYFVFSRREGDKTVSRRLKPGDDLEQTRRDIAEHKRFVELCRELERLTERLGEITRQGQQAQEKKRRRSSSKIKS